MKRRYKFGLGALAVMVMTLSGLAVTISYDAPCEKSAHIPADESMKAILGRCYGSPDILSLEDMAKPAPGSNEVLVRVQAASVNPYDYHFMRGKPYFMRPIASGFFTPNDIKTGSDYAGIVESVGSDVSDFAPGDRVFGARSGAFAEYVLVPADRGIVILPESIDFKDAAALPIAAVTALQAIRDSGQVQQGQKVLINGASGGVGTYAVQIAKAMGAEVTAVCSTRNHAMVRDLGADYLIDYKKTNYTKDDTRYDVIIDMIGNHALLDNRRVLQDKGKLIMVGAPKKDPWIGPLFRPISAFILSMFIEQELKMFLAQITRDDLQHLATMMAEGQLKSVIDRRYSLAEVADAMRYSESGRARGKIIIDI